MNLGRINYRLGELAAARVLLEACLPKFCESEWPLGVIFCLNCLGWIATDQSDFQRARVCFGEALSVSLEMSPTHPNSEALEGFAQLAEAEHCPRAALRLAAAAAAQREADSGPLSPAEVAQLEPRLQRARRA